MNKALSIETGLRIAILGYRSHPYVGGQGIYIHYLSKALAELGHEVVVYSGPPYPQLANNVKLVEIPGLDLYAKQKPLRSLTFRNLSSFTDLYEWLSKLTGGFAEPYTFGRRLVKYHLKALQAFDIVHDNQSLCYGLLDLQQAGCKVLATIHHPIHMDRELAIASANDPEQRMLIRRWYRFITMQEKVVCKLNQLVTVSQQSRRDIEKHFNLGHNKIEVIPNGIDTRIFKPLPTVNRKQGRMITMASSDQTLKGLHVLLQAFANIYAANPEAELVVVGKIKSNSLAQHALAQLDQKAAAKISFVSNLSAHELVEVYASASIAVCPSLYEGFGMPALEAMACGLPLISSDGGALPEVVGDAGVLVTAGNCEELAQACVKLLHDTQLQIALSEKALARVSTHYCWQSIAQRYLNFYRTCVAKYVDA